MERIHISTVLAEIDLGEADGSPRTFSLQYYKTDGTKGRKATLRKSGASGAGPGPAAGSGGFRYKVKEKGTLQVVDQKTGKPLGLKIILLTHYNGVLIRHA
ncbi:hypothetical protein [uncultured Hymenobacter sp.]|uniref:hypothetical protein n=1 Tax=uncultured Hymenobacter sp. TaxID=170016 RepID=UPI0035CA9C3F